MSQTGQARVADIAEQAGIAYGLVYHYFHNKGDILAAIFTERWAQYVNYLHEVGGMDLGFREQMRRLVHWHAYGVRSRAMSTPSWPATSCSVPRRWCSPGT